MMTEKMQQEIDAANYEAFVRKAFDCERNARRYPFADSRTWMTLIIRHNFAKDGNTKYEKEYAKYFKIMITNFEKTIDHILKKYANSNNHTAMIDTFMDFKDRLPRITSMPELMDIVNEAIAVYKNHGMLNSI